MPAAKLSEHFISGLPFCEGRQRLVYDSEIHGFGLRVSGKRKVFFAEKRLQGSGETRRRTIGPWPAFRVQDARREALKIISELSRGIDRKEVAALSHAKAIPLAKLFDAYLSGRTLKPKTACDYGKVFKSAFPDWGCQPWTSPSIQKVLKRHQELSSANGPGYANYAFRVLGAVVQFGINQYRAPDGSPLLAENPVLILTRARAWNKLIPRSRYVRPEHLKKWWGAVDALDGETPKDVLKVLMLTGLRSSEAMSLRWSNVDLEGKRVTIPETKNGKPHILPLSAPLVEIFERRTKTKSSPFVFQGKDKEHHFSELKRPVKRVVKASGILFSPHDLRRSFAVFAETLDLSGYKIKRLLNHASGGDVTMHHYLPIDVERLRDPMERIAKFVLGHAGQGESNVLPLAQVAAA